MAVEEYPFSELLSVVIDNRGKTCPTADSGIPLIATNCIRNELLYPTYDKVRFVSKETSLPAKIAETLSPSAISVEGGEVLGR